MKGYLTYKQAQDTYAVGRSKLQRFVVAGIVAAHQLGRKRLLKAEDLDRLFLAAKVAPKKKIGRPRRGAAR